MKLDELVKKNRSFRRFDESVPVEMDTLRELVDLTRYCASAANKQPLKYMLSCDAETNAKIFPNTAWAGALKNWPGPAEGERPTAYVIILCDKEVGGAGCDHGIAAQTILLAAAERGLGGCMLGALKRDALKSAFAIPDQYDISLVVALGKPAETVVVDEIDNTESTNYWRDENDVHHVPKRKITDIIVPGGA